MTWRHHSMLLADDAERVGRERLRTLAANLAVAAGLCRAFRLGFDAGWCSSGEGFNGEYTGKSFTAEKYERMANGGGENHHEEWRPGCQRSAE